MSRHGENIRKRKDGRWEGRYYTYEADLNKSVIHSVYAKTYSGVREKLIIAQAAAMAISKKCAVDKEICFDAVARDWLSTVKTANKHSTYIKYLSIYEKHLSHWLENIPIWKLDEFTLTAAFQTISNEKLSSSILQSTSCVLNQILKHAAVHYGIKQMHYSFYIKGEKPKLAEPLTQLEQIKLLKYLYDDMDIHKSGIVLCLSTGLRIGEICSLKWADIDLANKILYVNTTVQRIAAEGHKTKTILLEGAPKSAFSKRTIPLSDSIVELLLPYYNNVSKYVINDDNPMDPRTYQNKFHKYLELSCIRKKNFHILRHTFATNCINNGTDIKSLSEILGHSDVKITLNRYVHPTFEAKRQCMNSLSAIYGQFVGQQ